MDRPRTTRRLTRWNYQRNQSVVKVIVLAVRLTRVSPPAVNVNLDRITDRAASRDPFRPKLEPDPAPSPSPHPCLLGAEHADFLPDLLREIGGQPLDVGNRVGHHGVGQALRVERCHFRRQR